MQNTDEYRPQSIPEPVEKHKKPTSFQYVQLAYRIRCKTVAQKAVLVFHANHVKDGEHWHSYQSIRAGTEVGSDTTIVHANEYLRDELGVLNWEQGGGNQYAKENNLYRLNYERMKELANASRRDWVRRLRRSADSNEWSQPASTNSSADSTAVSTADSSVSPQLTDSTGLEYRTRSRTRKRNRKTRQQQQQEERVGADVASAPLGPTSKTSKMAARQRMRAALRSRMRPWCAQWCAPISDECLDLCIEHAEQQGMAAFLGGWELWQYEMQEIDRFQSLKAYKGGYKNHLVWAFLKDNRFAEHLREAMPYAERFHGAALIFLTTMAGVGTFELSTEQEARVAELGERYNEGDLDRGISQVIDFAVFGEEDTQNGLDEFLANPEPYMEAGRKAHAEQQRLEREWEEKREAEKEAHNYASTVR